MIKVTRSPHNPILAPDRSKAWEGEAVFNGCPVRHGNKIYLLYRALSFPHYHTEANASLRVSDIGRAESSDGVHFKNRERFIMPQESWERFGCEDPRVTKLGNRYYIFYTALSEYPFNANGIKVGVVISKDLKTIEEKHLVTPFNAKAMALFPEKIKGHYYVILAAHTDRPPAYVAIAKLKKIEDLWSENYWNAWERDLEKHALPLLRHERDQVEVGAPPIKTKDGWLVIYSYIKGYHTPRPLFTFEAVLLDLKDPTKIVGRTGLPIMVPEEVYELYGMIPGVIFPSGVLHKDDTLSIYYGATDTTCAVATVSLKELLRFIKNSEEGERKKVAAYFKRSERNPILVPDPQVKWKEKAVFNPAAIALDGKVHMVYRAMDNDNTSVFGYAVSKDGTRFTDYPEPIYKPREAFEEKRVPGGNSGCEDPRLTVIDKTIYMCYTAFNGAEAPRVALSSIPVHKFLKQDWDWAHPVLISPPRMDDKDACVFPEKVKGKYMIFHRLGESIDLAFTPSLKFDGTKWLEEEQWLSKRQGFWDSQKVGISAPPFKTKRGWMLFYHGVSEMTSVYRVGAVLLDLKDPTKILARSGFPLFEPEMPYEKEGIIPNVVFPCGAVLLKDKVYLYYGGADKVVGVATIALDTLLKALI
ncbi:MAG: hypothetical protein AAB691_01500 [Patescibacteria group bacterium]